MSRSEITIRPIHSGDRAALLEGFERLSPESRRRRFLSPKAALSERELAYLTEVDHVGHEALVALAPDGRLVGVARYALWSGRPDVADVAVTVADDCQGSGLGTTLVRRLLDAATRNGVRVLTGSTLWENLPARRLVKRAGFLPAGHDADVIDFRLELG